jgi:HAD superfamily hydrolase (TIGR01509 family)
MIKAAIFDMDGVLIEAKDWHYEALNRALGLFGFEINRYQHLTTYDGLPTRKKLEMLSLEGALPTELHAFINEMKQHYTMEIVHARCKPNFVHEFALSRLKSMNYRLGVASNSVRNSVEVMMSKSNLDRYLDFMLSNQDVSRGKPDPEIYAKSISILGLQPHECLVVEDHFNGIKAATAAGAHVMIVNDVNEVNIDNILNRIRAIDSVAA